jgi:glycosyltransferase involved in cell wall biosynthesis
MGLNAEESLGWVGRVPATLLFDTVLGIVSRVRGGRRHLLSGGTHHTTHRLPSKVATRPTGAVTMGSVQAGAPASPVHAAPGAEGRIRVLQVITRMNASGAAHHAAILNARLNDQHYETRLVAGSLGPGEVPLTDPPAASRGPVLDLPTLRPEIRPLSDLRALFFLIRHVRRFQPHVVSTHMAKAGFLGRVAALLAHTRPKPIVLHTYHGHVLEHYFGRAMGAVVRRAETRLASASDCLIGVSQAVVDDLIRLGVAPTHKFRTIPSGRDLSSFVSVETLKKRPFREELDLGDRDVLLVYVGRLVPIKRVDLIIEAFVLARQKHPQLHLAIVGDGPLRADLETLADERRVASDVHFLGFRTDLVAVLCGADFAILASDNEGLPAFLIEAAAARRPAVATAVGGVPDVIPTGGGILAPRGDLHALASAIGTLASDGELRESMGAIAQAHAVANYGADRLVSNTDRLLRELLPQRLAAAYGSATSAQSPRHHVT